VRLRQIGVQLGAYLLMTDVASQFTGDGVRDRRERRHTLLRTRDDLRRHGEDALAQRGRFEGTAHLDGAEVAGQQVRQPPLQTVIGLVPLQDLELGLKLASGPPLRGAKQGDQVRYRPSRGPRGPRRLTLTAAQAVTPAERSRCTVASHADALGHGGLGRPRDEGPYERGAHPRQRVAPLPMACTTDDAAS
jgi:hypothetical protein